MINNDNNMAITFADEMKQYSIEIWREILNHKFIIELSKGASGDSVPPEMFEAYTIFYFTYININSNTSNFFRVSDVP